MLNKPPGKKYNRSSQRSLFNSYDTCLNRGLSFTLTYYKLDAI